MWKERRLLGKPGLIIMGTVSILAAVATCDTYLVAVPRMLYGLSREGMLPKFFSYLHSTIRMPWYGIFFVVALILVVIVYAFINNANIESITTMISVALGYRNRSMYVYDLHIIR
ncbi:amino acid permease [Aneurinibacillus aneurinilyticus]|uniref:amino acid permease n=1 Tax=Aneurinibacillus aneurinilyticus TaxID=1391 RepID=UPI002E1AA084|nr:amino acid permease [Aneurinibacillus aneurinilyticus]